MNRRTFFAGLLALPAAVKAAISQQSLTPLQWTVLIDRPERHLIIHNFEGSRCSSLTRAQIQPLSPEDLQMLAQGEEEARKIDDVFKRIYALKRQRDSKPKPDVIWFPIQ